MKRTTPLKRGGPLRRRSRLRPISRKQRRALGRLADARRDLQARSGGRCEARFSAYCTGVGRDAHHIRPADRDEGRHEPDRMAWCCPPCHTLAPDCIHREPIRARAAGLLCESWETPHAPKEAHQ